MKVHGNLNSELGIKSFLFLLCLLLTSVAPYTGPNCGTCNLHKKNLFSYFAFYTITCNYEDIDYCQNNECQNDAICVPLVETKNYTCRCISGFFGPLCQGGKLLYLISNFFLT